MKTSFPSAPPSTNDQLSPVRSSRPKVFYAHVPLHDLAPAGTTLGGSTSPAALGEGLGATAVPRAPFGYFLEATLTPTLPAGLRPLDTLTVRVTVPAGASVAYLGGGRALFPLRTIIDYERASLTGATGVEGLPHRMEAALLKPIDPVVDEWLLTQGDWQLTAWAQERGLLGQEAGMGALRVRPEGFRTPFVFREAQRVLAELSDPAIHPDYDWTGTFFNDAMKVYSNRGMHLGFSGSLSASSDTGGELGVTSTTTDSATGELGSVGASIEVLHSPTETMGTIVHELMHVIDSDRPLSHELLQTLTQMHQGATEFQNLLRTTSLGTYWKEALTDDQVNALASGSGVEAAFGTLESREALAETFAEFGRAALDHRAGNFEGFPTLADFLADRAPASTVLVYRHIAETNTREPLPCLGAGAGRAFCRYRAADEASLAAFHKANLTGNDAEATFATGVEDLTGEPGRLVSPLTEVGETIRSVDSAADLASLPGRVSAALGRDLTRLEVVSTQASTIQKALAGAKTGALWGGKALPYVAIAATGYALSQDVATGDWVDTGFDGAAEALMLAELAAPELSPVILPMLIADVVAQLVVDHFRAVPPPPMSAAQREKADEDFAAWKALPGVLAKLRVTVAQDQLRAAMETWTRDSLAPKLSAQLASDTRTLSAMKDAHRAQAYIASVKANGGRASGVGWEKLRPQLEKTLTAIDEAFARTIAERRARYARIMGEQAQEVADLLGPGWGAGTAAFEAIRQGFDQAVALPAVTAAEQRMSQWSVFQSPPISYPSEDIAAFREKLKTDALTAYEERVAETYPNPLRVVLPNDPEENIWVLTEAGTGSVRVSGAWGTAVPGGVTEEILLSHAGAVSGVMRIIAPKGSILHSLRTSRDPQVPVAISSDRREATVGADSAPVAFGSAHDAVQVFVRVKTPADAKQGTVLTGGQVRIVTENGARTLLSSTLDAVVRDTIPTAHAFTPPGGIAEVPLPGVPASHRMTVTAPASTAFVPASVAGHKYSSDLRTLTIVAGAAAVPASSAQIRVPAAVTWDTTLAGRIVIDDATGTPEASGVLMVSTDQISVEQVTSPSIAAGETDTLTVRVSNRTGRSATGLTFQATAPAGTVFDTDLVDYFGYEDGDLLRATRSDDGRTLRLEAPSLTIDPGDPANFIFTLRAVVSGGEPAGSHCGGHTAGCFHVEGRIVPSGKSIPLNHTLSVHRLGPLRVELGPGQRRFTTVPMPTVDLPGTFTVSAPKSTKIGTVTVTRNGRKSTWNTNAESALVRIPGIVMGPDTDMVVELRADSDARPGSTASNTMTLVGDDSRTLATGELITTFTTAGCLSWRSQQVFLAFFIWTRWAVASDRCSADIDAKVVFDLGGSSSWQTVEAHS